MAHIPGLRSPHDKLGGIVYLGRMLDKIRLHAQGKLPPDYVTNLGQAQGMFDQRCLTFLGIDYDALVDRTLLSSSDEEVLAWIHANGLKRTEEEIEIWNAFMSKRGWRDAARERLEFRIQEAGFQGDHGIETMFDFIDADEGRPLLPWNER